ncbi:MAG TPA: hypothetical protein VHD60_03410 [Candidatus Saccharimonadales bacterium]|nr:hypothetical protein [Candidatus Saccharimonadales bacterium]
MTHGENALMAAEGEGWKTSIRHNLFGLAPEKLSTLFDKVYGAALDNDNVPDGSVTSAILDMQNQGELRIFLQHINTPDGAQQTAYVQRCAQQQLAS